MLSRRRISYYTIILTQIIAWLPINCLAKFENTISSSPNKFSQPFVSGAGFHPKISEESINVIFSNDGQFKVFAEENAVVDLRNSRPETSVNKYSHPVLNNITETSKEDPSLHSVINKLYMLKQPHGSLSRVLKKHTMKQIAKFLLRHGEEMLSNSSYELFSGFRIDPEYTAEVNSFPNILNERLFGNGSVGDELQSFANNHVMNINVPRAVESGRLFFFKGLKKMMWTLFVGLQIVKTVLLALFLPSILGSLGKIVGKGITSVSGFNHPTEAVNDLDFKDNTYNLDQDNKFDDYMYPQAEASNNHFATQMYDSGAANTNALSRFGIGDQKLTYVNSGMNMYTSKNSNINIMSTKKNNFKDFLDIPASSLLLTNYDPFYSPLLSRLDAVFQQLGLQKGNEICREKMVCLMYANPAKYAPYSNLVSAQLSRELNELRKPTIDNPDILRFFKYMKAAKDGQDEMDCQNIFKECTGLKNTENPAMLTTYNDINKLVQARKL